MDKIKTALLVGAATLLAACAATPTKPKVPDLTGQWSLTTESPVGIQHSDMIVKQTGTQLTGTISSATGPVEYKGELTGNDITFVFRMGAPGMPLQLEYKGIVEGDTMKGVAKLGDFGEGNFTAKRKTD